MSVSLSFLRIAPFYFSVVCLLVVIHFDLLDRLVMNDFISVSYKWMRFRGIRRFSVGHPMIKT